MKKLLDSIVAKESSSENSLPIDSRKSTRQEPQPSRFYEAKCIFYDKYLKGQRTKESLTKCAELRADDAIRRATTRKRDIHLLATVSRELVAHYHRTCYRAYTKELEKDTNESNMGGRESPYEAAERMALSKVFSYIREELIEHPTVVPFIDLTTMLVTEMA